MCRNGLWPMPTTYARCLEAVYCLYVSRWNVVDATNLNYVISW
jgi:hypothetical protein